MAVSTLRDTCFYTRDTFPQYEFHLVFYRFLNITNIFIQSFATKFETPIILIPIH